jgi:hypothetical protein
MYGDVFHGHGFHIRDWSGWVGSADVVRDNLKRPNTHGRFPAKQTLDAREVPAAGFLVADSFDERLHMLQQLTALTVRDSFRLQVELDGVTTWGDAHLSEYPRIDASGVVPEAEWSAVFTFDDPLVYGDTRTFPSSAATSVYAYHYGSVPAYPILTVTQTGSGGYVITNESSEFRVASSVAGAVDRIDMRTGRLYRNGVLQPAGSLRRDVWNIPGGTRVLHTITGAGLLKVTVTDTWG